MPSYFPEGDTPQPQDYAERSLQKINNLLTSGGGGGGSGSIPMSLPTCGAGSPEGIVDGNCGRTYVDTNDGTKYAKITAAGTLTGWV